MRIKPEQENILSSFRCIRVKNLADGILSSVRGPIIGGVERSGIIDLFRHEKHLTDEANNELASYVVLDSHNTVLIYFSLRCGELFENLDYEKLELAKNFLEIYRKFNNDPESFSQEEHTKLRELKGEISKAGLTAEDILYLGKKKSKLIDDLNNEPIHEVARVSEVFPGVELKFFGVTENGKRIWNETHLPGKIGVVLFWRYIIPKLEEMQSVVGCKYLYLFAADGKADGELVSYYRTRLHMDAQHGLTSNKPTFDFSSWFLYQEISELKRQRDIFFDNFNSEVI